MDKRSMLHAIERLREDMLEAVSIASAGDEHSARDIVNSRIASIQTEVRRSF